MTHPFLTAEWRNLVMLNYAVDPAVLRPLVPKGTELDCWQGMHFLSVVGFQYFRTRLRGLSIPFHRDFAEVNLRFYVRRNVPEGWRRGVVFVKEVVPRLAIALVARWCYNENFVAHPLCAHVHLPRTSEEPGGAEYTWTRSGQTHRVRAEFRGSPMPAAPESEEAFISGQYFGYVTQRTGATLEYQVDHPPWRLWPASAAELDCDVERFYGPQYTEALHRPPHSAFVAEGSPVAVLPGRPIAL